MTIKRKEENPTISKCRNENSNSDRFAAFH
jgi:hypothetical protein